VQLEVAGTWFDPLSLVGIFALLALAPFKLMFVEAQLPKVHVRRTNGSVIPDHWSTIKLYKYNKFILAAIFIVC